MRHFTLLLLLLLAACADREGRPGVTDSGTTPFNDPENRFHPERRHDFDVLHYAIQIAPDFEKKRVYGVVEITFSPAADAIGSIKLDAGDMVVHAVTVDGRKARFSHRGETLSISLGASLRNGQRATAEIRYTARPTSGLFFVGPDKGYPNKPRQVWTQGEPQYNHLWFPCYDYPNDRATTELWITAPEKMTVISIGELRDVEEFKVTASEALAMRLDDVRGSRKHVPSLPTEEGRYRIWHWVMEQDAVAYLTSVVIGEFDVFTDSVTVGGREIPLHYNVPKDRLTTGEAELMFGVTFDMMTFYSRLFGFDYPYAKYDQTLVMDFSWGGMENITATTLNGDRLLAGTQPGSDYSPEGLIAHELVHMWFGDLLTCRTWAHLWLNESFATFFTNWWFREKKGQAEFEYAIYNQQQGTIRESKEYQRPIVNDVYTDPDDMFDTRTYGGGAVMLNMLRHVIGTEAFLNGVHTYVSRHAHQTVVTSQLVDAMETASEMELDWFFNQWIHKTTHPRFRVSYKWDPITQTLAVDVEQTQEISDRVPVFQTPVDIAITTADGTVQGRREIDEAVEQFLFQVTEKPLFVDFDAGSWILKEMEFDKPLEELVYQLLHDKDVGGRIWAARQLTTREGGEVALVRAATDDPFYGVRAEVIEALATRADPSTLETIEQARKDPDYRVRAAAIKALAKFPEIPDCFDAVWDSAQTDSSLTVVSTAAESLAAFGQKGYDAMLQLLKSRPNVDDVTVGVIRGLTELKDPNGYATVESYTRYGKPGWVRYNAVEALARWATPKNPKRTRAQTRLLKLARDRSFRVRRAALGALGDAGDPAVIPELQLRARSEPDARLRRAARRAIRKIQQTP